MFFFILILSIYSLKCPGHLNPKTNCTTCQKHWINIEKLCDKCEVNFDIKRDCLLCIKECSGPKCEICNVNPNPKDKLQQHEIEILFSFIVFLIICAISPFIIILGCMIFCFVMFKCLKISSVGDIKKVLRKELKSLPNKEDKQSYGKLDDEEEEGKKETLISKDGSIN